MRNIFLTNYCVKGIKTLDELVEVSFYKKTITKPIETQSYNIKGIYGMNGSGKSGIVTSVDILKNLIQNNGYLNNPIAQKYLDSIINKKISNLQLEAEFLCNTGRDVFLYRYDIELAKEKSTQRYVIKGEKLACKKAVSKREKLDCIYEVKDGEIVHLYNKNNSLISAITKKSMNLLSMNTLVSIFLDNIFMLVEEEKNLYQSLFFNSMASLVVFGRKIHVYMDKSDDHTNYIVKDMMNFYEEVMVHDDNRKEILENLFNMANDTLQVLSPETMLVSTDLWNSFSENVKKLEEFIKIFKTDLQAIEIDRKEDKDVYVCSLVMVYDDYKVNAEFESTGIKKLIKLFVYLREMVRGEIVFIDEFDSNLHDVYLCALLEYLMEYGEGQLCFTTHNVGPMDILKRNKKSIDFLSIDHKIYPWKANGNYSPSNLYRNGMIEGSPFNVDSIDFIGILDSMGEDD